MAINKKKQKLTPEQKREKNRLALERKRQAEEAKKAALEPEPLPAGVIFTGRSAQKGGAASGAEEKSAAQEKTAVYLGMIEIRGTFYNFRPIGRMTPHGFSGMSQAAVEDLLPLSEMHNINLSYNVNSRAQVQFMESHFYDHQIMALEFSKRDLQENRDSSGVLNKTAYRIGALESYNGRRILRFPSEDKWYRLVRREALEKALSSSDRVNIDPLKSDQLVEGEKVLVATDLGFYAGPYEVKYGQVDKKFFIYPGARENFYILKGIPEERVHREMVWDDSGSDYYNAEAEEFYRVDWMPQPASYDVITDEQLLESVSSHADEIRSAGSSGENIEQFLKKQRVQILNSLKIPEEIRRERRRRVRELLFPDGYLPQGESAGAKQPATADAGASSAERNTLMEGQSAPAGQIVSDVRADRSVSAPESGQSSPAAETRRDDLDREGSGQTVPAQEALRISRGAVSADETDGNGEKPASAKVSAQTAVQTAGGRPEPTMAGPDPAADRSIVTGTEAAAADLPPVGQTEAAAADLSPLEQAEADLSAIREKIACESVRLELAGQELGAKKRELQKITEELDLAADVQSLTQKKKTLQQEEELLRKHLDSIESDAKGLEERFDALLDSYKGKIADISFDGYLSSRMIQAASQWENHEEARDYDRLVEEENRSDIPEKSDADLLDYIVRTVQRVRPAYSRNEIVNLMICVSQGFLTVLSGAPGSGKTSICNILARTLGLSGDGVNRYCAVSVERGWTSKRDFVGYYNPLTRTFEESSREVYDALRLLDAECRHKTAKMPYLILMDEANLSPMEYYWADFMNVSDDLLYNHSINLGNEHVFEIPETLHFLATINNDHTTETLSPRLIDRAFVVTLPRVSRVAFQNDDLEEGIEPVSWKDLKRTFCQGSEQPVDSSVSKIYDALRDLLEQNDLHLSPRSEIAVSRYLRTAAQLMEEEAAAGDTADSSPLEGNAIAGGRRIAPAVVALDFAVAQKILPKLQGSGEDYRDWLISLRDFCAVNDLHRSETLLHEIVKRGDKLMNYYQFFH